MNRFALIRFKAWRSKKIGDLLIMLWLLASHTIVFALLSAISLWLKYKDGRDRCSNEICPLGSNLAKSLCRLKWTCLPKAMWHGLVAGFWWQGLGLYLVYISVQLAIIGFLFAIKTSNIIEISTSLIGGFGLAILAVWIVAQYIYPAHRGEHLKQDSEEYLSLEKKLDLIVKILTKARGYSYRHCSDCLIIQYMCDEAIEIATIEDSNELDEFDKNFSIEKLVENAIDYSKRQKR